ncbi:MAG: PQQ-binding-like beta-propeller repeat protein [Alphaproteobacteria bacterium]
MMRVLLGLVLAVLLAGCGLFGDKKKDPLPGERIPIMLLDRQLEADDRIADLAVRLPPPEVNPDWPQTGGYADHAMHHLAIAEVPKRAWQASIGTGSSRERRVLTQPIVANGHLFAMDAEGQVSAYEAQSGRRLWRTNVLPEDAESDAIGGGIAFDDGTLYVTTGAAQVLALNPENGKILWRQVVTAPLRSGPTVANGRVFAVSVDNQLHALDARDGNKLWTHTGIAEIASLLGGSSPAVESGVVVAPFTSGEIVALRIENGRQVWQDTLIAVRRVDAVSGLADIRALPVMDRGRVYAISHSGRMAAIDLRSGSRVWDIPLASVQTPWIAGDFLFVVTTMNEVACLSRRDGRVRWVVQLPTLADPKKPKEKIFWVGPVLAADRLIVASSHGRVVSLSPYDGSILGEIKLSSGIHVSPVVANEMLYVLTDDADLIAFK